jgi:glycosyltransferase involved in cell wall biosynthesis
MEFTVEQPLISCIVPVYNGELYLREAIDSILAQTYRPLEIIVVDDGSTDGTSETIASYGQRIRHFRQNKAGPWVARNLGLSLTQGEFVAFQDADDLWHPEKLARQMERFATSPEIDLCFTHAKNFWISDLTKEAERFRDQRISRPLPAYTCPTLLARRCQFDKFGLFDETVKHAAATHWVVRAIRHGAVTEMLPDVLMFRRLHHTNYSRTSALTSRDEYLRFVKMLADQRRVGMGRS